jgi:integrase
VDRGEPVASIDKRSGKWRVRWRDPDGTARSRTCPNKATAQRLVADVEQAVAEGRRWEPRDARPVVDLPVMLRAYAVECARVLKPATAERYARALDMFLRYLHERFGDYAALPGSILTRRLLGDFYDDLATGGLHGRPRSAATQRKITEVVQLAWAWLYDDEEYGPLVPPPRKLRMAREPGAPAVAPTWAEMDACIDRLRSWHRDVAFILRCTGLRVQQVIGLRWEDLDARRGLLTIRGELGKSKQEQRGRRIPLAPLLLQELATWDRGPDGFIITSARHRGGDRERMPRAALTKKGWQRAGVREEVWRKRPNHAFRKGFISELKRLGADADAVEYLVGHSLGLRGVYLDPSALPLRDTVALVPTFDPTAFEPEETHEPKFGAIDPRARGPLREITLDGEFLVDEDGTRRRIRRDRVCPPRVPQRPRRQGNVVFLDTWQRNGGGGGNRTRVRSYSTGASTCVSDV